MKRRIVMLVLAICLMIPVLTIPARADFGPKPSVTVTFRQEDWQEPYFVTLLSEQTASGPWSTKSSGWSTEDQEDLTEEFRSYQDSDGYHFLNYYEDCTDTGVFHWGYYPPERFKVLVYCPASQHYYVSGAQEQYAFQSMFEGTLNNGVLTVERIYSPWMQAAGFLFRLVMTVVLELLVGLLFGYRRPKQLLVILAANVATQLVLNLMLQDYPGAFFYFLLFGWLEVLIFLAEAVIYTIFLPRFEEQRSFKGKPALYALLANLLSFLTGWFLLDHMRFLI